MINNNNKNIFRSIRSLIDKPTLYILAFGISIRLIIFIILAFYPLENISEGSVGATVYQTGADLDHYLDFMSIIKGEEGARDKMHRFQTLGTGEHTWLPTNKSFEYLMKKVKLNYEHLQDTSKGIFVKAWKRT